MNRFTHRGFTLIELLVVVAIIIALLAILLPSMGRALHAAQMTQCLSNLKQTGTGLLSAAADNYGKYEKYNFNKPTLLKEGAVDARTRLNPYIAFNELACPFTERINYVDPPITSHSVEWTYVWFAGWQFSFESDGLTRPGDTFKHGSNQFGLLVADQLWTRIDGTFTHSSHPGRGMGLQSSGANTGGVATTRTYDANSYTFFRWDNPAANFSTGGETDQNYLYTDLSGKMVNHITYQGDQVERIEFFRQPNGWYLWVPLSQ